MTQGRRVDQLPKSVAAVADCLQEMAEASWARLNEKLPWGSDYKPVLDREALEHDARQILERALAAGEL